MKIKYLLFLILFPLLALFSCKNQGGEAEEDIIDEEIILSPEEIEEAHSRKIAQIFYNVPFSI